MIPNNFKSPQYRPQEDGLIIRLHAEGKTNPEIYTYLPHRPPSGIDKRMDKLLLTRNYAPRTPLKKPVRDRTEVVPVKWPASARFENITPTEARQISADAPASAPFRKQNIHWSIYGNPMAEMIA